MLKKNLSFVNR